VPRLDLNRREIAFELGIDPNRVSKVKSFIRQLARQSAELSYWQLLRQSDEDVSDEIDLTKLSDLYGAQPSTPFTLGNVGHG
jgi:hypothetical protein